MERSLKRLNAGAQLLTIILVCATPLFAQWEPDRRLTNDFNWSGLAYNNARCIATAPGGVTHVVWEDNRDSNMEIYYKRSTDAGTSWTTDTRLTNSTRSSRYPSIAVTGSTLFLFWQENFQIFYRRSTDSGGSWSAVDSFPTSRSDVFPCVFASGANVYVVWQSGTTSSNYIYYRQSSNSGGTWSTVTTLAYVPAALLQKPAIAAWGMNLHVVWQQDIQQINYRRSRTGGATWEAATRLSFTINQAINPSITVSDTTVHVVWSGSRPYLYYKVSYSNGTTWANEAPLTSGGDESWYPSIISSQNNLHLVWQEAGRDANPEVYYKSSSNAGGTWSSDVRLSNIPDASISPFVATSDNGVHVVWSDTRDGNNEVYYKRNLTGNSGIEYKEGIPSNSQEKTLKVEPNPFSSSAVIRGGEKESFTAYDITGKRVGTQRGDRIGEDLEPGVYFLRPAVGMGDRLIRIIKLK